MSTLTKDELRKLRSTARGRGDQATRDEAMRMLIAGKNLQQVAARFRVSTTTVSKWRKDALAELEDGA